MGFLPLIRFGRIERRLRAFRVSRYTSRFDQLLVIIRTIPVARPLPNVTGHIVKSVTVRWKPSGSAYPDVMVFPGILNRKLTLKGVRHPLSIWAKFIPKKWLARQSAAGREFPFRL